MLFRVDAGVHIGLGHFQRCLALATALKKCSAEISFLVNENQCNSDRIGRWGFTSQPLHEVPSWTIEDAKATIGTAIHQGCDRVVVDSHEVPADYLAMLTDSELFIIARDDLALSNFPCHMVFNGNADARQLPYHSTNGDTVFLLGPEYAVLGPQYHGTSGRGINTAVQNILITMGGEDRYNLVPDILGLLDKMPGDFSVTTVIGPFSQNVTEVESAAKRAQRTVKLSYSLDSLRDMIVEADMAISAAGQTLYDLACTGCPTVAIKVAGNQIGQTRAFEEAGFLRVAGDAEKDDVLPPLREVISSLLSDREARTAMSGVGRRLVDGQGAMRVAKEILAIG